MLFPRKGGAIEEDGYVAASHANICTSFLPAVYIHLKVLWGKAGGLFTVSVLRLTFIISTINVVSMYLQTSIENCTSDCRH